jgi:hypothetical protein
MHTFRLTACVYLCKTSLLFTILVCWQWLRFWPNCNLARYARIQAGSLGAFKHGSLVWTSMTCWQLPLLTVTYCLVTYYLVTYCLVTYYLVTYCSVTSCLVTYYLVTITYCLVTYRLTTYTLTCLNLHEVSTIKYLHVVLTAILNNMHPAPHK